MAYPLPISGGFIPSSWPWNWWQQGRNPVGHADNVAAVQSATDAYAQAIASIPAGHFEILADESRSRMKNSAVNRVLRNPNGYQTGSDFKLNGIKSLLLRGNMYAVALRNDRNEVRELHLLPHSTTPYIEPETKAVFYGLGDNPMLGSLDMMVPARDVFHLRLYTPRHPLVGVSPIESAAASIMSNAAITHHQASFFNRMSRPSGVLSTDAKLNRDQMAQLREAWEEQAKGMDAGGIPILSSGIKWESMGISSQDAQLVEAFNMTVNDIARAFRVPLPIIQLYDQGSTYNNVEQLYSQWLSGGLGFLVEHMERALEKFFGLPESQCIHFNTDALLRTDFAGRVEGYTKLVQGGLMTPNEARHRLDSLPRVKNGDTPMVQQQMVPLGWTEQQPAPEPAPAPADPDPTVEDNLDPDVTKALVVNLLSERKKRGAA